MAISQSNGVDIEMMMCVVLHFILLIWKMVIRLLEDQ